MVKAFSWLYKLRRNEKWYFFRWKSRFDLKIKFRSSNASNFNRMKEWTTRREGAIQLRHLVEVCRSYSPCSQKFSPAPKVSQEAWSTQRHRSSISPEPTKPIPTILLYHPTDIVARRKTSILEIQPVMYFRQWILAIIDGWYIRKRGFFNI